MVFLRVRAGRSQEMYLMNIEVTVTNTILAVYEKIDNEQKIICPMSGGENSMDRKSQSGGREF